MATRRVRLGLLSVGPEDDVQFVIHGGRVRVLAVVEQTGTAARTSPWCIGQQTKGLVVACATEVPVDEPLEDGSGRRDAGEERCARVEFHVVRRAEHVVHGPPFDAHHRLGAFQQTGTEHRVAQVCLRLRGAPDGVLPGGRAESKAVELREDIPHPMRPLQALKDLRERLLVGLFLRPNETSQVVGVVRVDSGSRFRHHCHAAELARLLRPSRRRFCPVTWHTAWRPRLGPTPLGTAAPGASLNDFKARKRLVARSEERGQVTSTKGNRVRYVPMTERLSRALQHHRHLKSRRVLCASDGTPLTANGLAHLVERATRNAGLVTGRKPKDAGPHVLRHTFCSSLAMRGAPAPAIQLLAGHRDLMTTQRYVHLTPAAIESAIRLLELPKPPGVRGNSGATEQAAGSKC